jgi:hypothetical protein
MWMKYIASICPVSRFPRSPPLSKKRRKTVPDDEDEDVVCVVGVVAVGQTFHHQMVDVPERLCEMLLQNPCYDTYVQRFSTRMKYYYLVTALDLTLS